MTNKVLWYCEPQSDTVLAAQRSDPAQMDVIRVQLNNDGMVQVSTRVQPYRFGSSRDTSVFLSYEQARDLAAGILALVPRDDVPQRCPRCGRAMLWAVKPRARTGDEGLMQWCCDACNIAVAGSET